MISDAKLEFWIKHNLNVLFVGRHGVGKTATIKQAFDRAGLRWKYFSAATMDPWVDFIGVPKEREVDGIQYLDLVRPLEFQRDEVEALFFDEFNRAHKKVRNAVMELLQFKSVNGRKFNNLRIIWAAINPDDAEEYDVERLDPAQEDRFEVKVELPYKPELKYFVGQYGQDVARAAIAWWTDLPDDQKKLVSPRRLDYAMRVWSERGDVRDIIPASANCAKLLSTLKTGPIYDVLKSHVATNDKDSAKTFIEVENNYAAALSYFAGDSAIRSFFLPLLSAERLCNLLTTSDVICDFVLDHAGEYSQFSAAIVEVVNANQNKKLVRKLRKAMGAKKTLISILGVGHMLSNGRVIGDEPPARAAFNSTFIPNGAMRSLTDGWKQRLGKSMQTYDRKKLLDEVLQYIPSTLPTTDALEVLKVLALLAKRSHASTLKDWDKSAHIVGIMNHCIQQIHVNEGLWWPEILKKYGGAFPDLLSKLSESGLGGTILCPIQKDVAGQIKIDKEADDKWKKKVSV